MRALIVVAASVVLSAPFALPRARPQSQSTASALLPPPKDQLGDADLDGTSRLGLPDAIPGVESTPLALAQARLGRRLFFDPLLSFDRTVSCASCHRQEYAFATDDVKPPGIGGATCDRNSPPVFNRAFSTAQFWDGRAPSLEAQVLQPIENPKEMGLPLADALARLGADATYRELFAAAGAAAPDAATLAAALAQFLRRLVVGDSPIDRFRAARGTLTAEEKRGLWLFESRGHCWKCHSGPNFSDESFHATGVGAKDGIAEPGRFAVTHDAADRGRFKTPTLRMLAKTAPYMHDGSMKTLEDVVRFYVKGGNPNANLDERIEPLVLDDADVKALVAFLEALSRRAPPLTDDDLPKDPPAPKSR